MSHRVGIEPLIILNKNFLKWHLFYRNSSMNCLQISSTFKFSFIFKLFYYTDTLSITNSVHMSLNSNCFTRTVEWIWYQQTTNELFQPITTISDQIFAILRSIWRYSKKLHSIFLTLFSWVSARSVGYKLSCN